MRDVQAQVLGIEQGLTKTGKTRWDVKLSNGETVTAWDLALATKAGATGGQVATFRIEDKPGNNGVVYKNLKEVAGAGEGLAPVIPAPGSPVSLSQPTQAPGAIQITPAAPKPAGGSSGSYGMSPEDKIRVTKLSCIGSAAILFQGSGDIEAVLDAAKTIFNAVMPQPEAVPVAVAPPVLAAVQVGTEGITPAAEPVALPWS